MLSSQVRNITCYFTNPRTIHYIIPMYSSLESCMGASLEIELNLPISHQYHEAYKTIIKDRSKLLPVPNNQTPTIPLDFKYEKGNHKTFFTITEKSGELR